MRADAGLHADPTRLQIGDSDRRTFSLAARGAFWDGMWKAGPKIQEP
jgi:hypothetical protein